MKFLLIALFSAGVAGCSSDCPVEIGDKVKGRTDNKNGVVMDIGSGSMTSSCSIAVLHDDNTTSISDNAYGDGLYDTSREYVTAWKYERL